MNDVPMDQWKPDEVEAHIQFMNDFATRLESTGEFIDGRGAFARRHVGPLRRRGTAAE